MITSWPLTVAPYAVQSEALRRTAGQESYALLMEQGTGKTAVTLAEFCNLTITGHVKGLVVICPNSIKRNWINEAVKMGAPLAQMAAWPSKVKTRLGPWMQTMNYEATITERGREYLGSLLRDNPCMLVLDESTQIKNHQAKRTKSLIHLGKFARVKRILTGAPVTQGPQDLWSQFRFLGATGDVNFYSFRNRFCVMGGWQGKQVIGPKNEEELNGFLNEWSFRARKQDWLDLPKKIYSVRHIEMTNDQKRSYKTMKEDFMAMVEGEQVDVTMVLTQMLKLQEIGSGFLMDDEGRSIPLPGTNPKLQVVQEILEETVGKTIIFTYFRYSARLLKNTLGVQAAVIVGGMPPGDLEIALARFKDDPSCRVLIAQVQSAKYGLTLLGGDDEDRCHTTIFYENSFSLDARIQAEDRNHRIGQDQPVTYIDLIASDIDALAVTALQRKQNVALAVVDGIRISKTRE